MRFRLILSNRETTKKGDMLPLNYQYELSSWIYKLINLSDTKFARWLHETGYALENRKFKMFTFSNLRPEHYSIVGDRMIIDPGNSELIVSFYLPEGVEHFIKGLFRNHQFQLGDNISKVDFIIREVEKLPEIEFSHSMRFNTLSPLVISRTGGSESRHARYLSPVEEKFGELLTGNLINKYVALAESGLAEVRNREEFVNGAVKMELAGQPRQKLVKIKAGTPEQVFLKGFLFEFRLTAPVELMRIGYYGGFGEKNSLGFGCCDILTT